MPALTAPAYTLPTIHLNGTSAKSLTAEYYKVYKAVNRACQALAAATCNARDFYPQGPAAYQQAHRERAEALQKLKEVQDLAEAWMARASGDI